MPDDVETLDLFSEESPLNETHRKYLVWKADNADVLALIKRTALKLLARRRRFSIDAVVHHVRFNEFFQGYRDDPYRINNNHVAYIARDLRKECPEIDEFIQVRVVRGEEEKEESLMK
jgi:hypothetical protein